MGGFIFLNNTNMKSESRIFDNNNYELLEHTDLKVGDIVDFNFKGTVYRHTVHSHFLSYQHDNQKIFDVLGLNKINVCTAVYGYRPESGVMLGGWPETRNSDEMNKLTALVIYLFEEISLQDPNSMNPIVKFNVAPLTKISF